MGNKSKNILEGYTELSRQMAAEGMVLLKNDGQMLPFNKEDNVSVFGRCQIDYYRSGTGSGGSVNVPYTVNALEGLRNSNIRLNEDLAGVYEDFVKEHPFDNGGGAWASEPWFQKEMGLDDAIVEKARRTSNKAMVIIGRTAGEDQDNKMVGGSYLLTELEVHMIEKVCAHFEEVLVVLNVANIIDMSWLTTIKGAESIKSILYAWHGGMEGGNALADILSGEITPSGKLADTIAKHVEDYPSNDNFHREDHLFYQEDIYVGYRYFETFNKEAVIYPFGYGLSYTTFEVSLVKAIIEDASKPAYIKVFVEVTNSGDTYCGKEVIQLYYEAPQGKLGKPSRVLGAFGKTKVLAPGESEVIELTMLIASMASYDDGGASGAKSAYVLEAGEYYFYMGTDVRHTECVEFNGVVSLSIEQLRVVEQLEEALAPTKAFDRMKPGEKSDDGLYELCYEPVPIRTIDLEKRMEDRRPKPIEITGDKGYKLMDVKSGRCSMDDFIAQIDPEDLQVIVRGEGMCSPRVRPGTAGAFGGVSDKLLGVGIPVASCADGPSGIRMDNGDEAIQVPIGTLIACSFNPQMAYELYGFMGQELHDNEIDSLLGPGINIHRHPLNGRNFEYFSEDPLVTGEMAVAITKGLNSAGVWGTIKHFAANDQEHHRSDVDSIVSERALREIHLKGFEMAVKEGATMSIMTSYNPINGIWGGSNYDLNTTILREEWGYKGMVMTDWWAKMNDPIEGGEAERTNLSAMVRAQNDVYMLVNNFGAQVNSKSDNLPIDYAGGKLSLGELQRCAKNICRFVIDSPVIERPVSVAEVLSFEGDSSPQTDGLVQSIEKPVEFNTATDKSVWIEVKEEGVYALAPMMRYDQDIVAQSTCNLLVNDVFAGGIQVTGTWGDWVKQKSLNLQLSKGFYKFAIVYTKPGFELGNIEFIKL